MDGRYMARKQMLVMVVGAGAKKEAGYKIAKFKVDL